MKCKCSIDALDWGEISREISLTTPAAKKTHRCGECHEKIEPGEKYERYAGIGDDGFFSAKTCLPCAEIRDCFCCSYYFGQVWEAIHEEIWDLELCTLDAVSKPAREKFFEEFDMERLES